MILDIPDVLEVYVPDFKYLLYDLSHYSHRDIRGEGELRVFLEIVSSFFRDDFEERFKDALILLEKLRKQQKGIEYFETVIRYIINAKESMGVNDLKGIVKSISTERGEEVMTIAEQLKKEGEEETKLEIARRMLKKGMDVEDIKDITKLSKEEIKEIKGKAHH
jgi:predicted transposase/invertase (TIGR01784 family)